jgi:serine/threonine protein kinase
VPHYAFAQDSDRLARFEREARTLASLTHPNIAQIMRTCHRTIRRYLRGDVNLNVMRRFG